MKQRLTLLCSTVLLLSQFGRAQLPNGFSWVNIESNRDTMARVRAALRDPSITAIREVGLRGNFALVMTASREVGAPTPDYDQWSIYNISLKTSTAQVLVFGNGVRLLDWFGTSNDELAITYYDCWECEATAVFTTIRFEPGFGWRACWQSKSKDVRFPQPGVVVRMTDVGDPYDDDELDQIFAVVAQPAGGFAVGSWAHSRNTKTGNIEDDVERYSFDKESGKDRIEKLSGTPAVAWERIICIESNVVAQPSFGQDSASCRRVLRNAANKK